MKTFSRWLLTLLLFAPAISLAADWVLVANPRAGIGRLSQDEVTNIYLGRYRRLASGETAVPIDLPVGSSLRAQFYRQLVNKSLPEINAYWARLIFSGKTQPPGTANSSEEAVQMVVRNKAALAYVERARADSRVVIVFEMVE